MEVEVGNAHLCGSGGNTTLKRLCNVLFHLGSTREITHVYPQGRPLLILNSLGQVLSAAEGPSLHSTAYIMHRFVLDPATLYRYTSLLTI